MSEKTEAATPHKKREARKKGQVSQSQDLTKALILITVSECTLQSADIAVGRLSALIRSALDATRLPFPASAINIFYDSLIALGWFSAMSIGVAVFMRLVGSWAQFGLLFAPGALKLQWSKLNPLGNAAQMFSTQSLSTLGLSVVKASLISVLLYITTRGSLDALVQLTQGDLVSYWHGLLAVFQHTLRVIFGVLLVEALIDFGLQKYFEAKRMRMSKEDIKNENKQQEGDPHIKQERRKLSHQFLSSQTTPVIERDPADAIVVNPTHYAVGLYFRPGETPLPMIHSKGQDDEAIEIIKLAHEQGIPVIRSIWLARTLYGVAQGGYIPKATLTEVARIYRLLRELEDITDEIIELEENRSVTGPL